MPAWPKHPILYEIPAWVWLDALGRKHGRPVSLSSVPPGEWDALAAIGCDAIWLMGVWERSPAGREIANRHPALLDDLRRALPDYRPDDNVGSPYCIRRYAVDDRLGGREGLAAAREALARRGLKLILDFVPNHVAPDHPWVSDHPEYFVRGSEEDARDQPESFVRLNGRVFALGRDPHFPAWPDVLQLNAYQGGLRRAATATLLDIAGQCDGVRCDMAVLTLNPVFGETWRVRAGLRPATEYWEDLIGAVKAAHPHFLFVAEAYWDLEWELQQQGFDFCYDKRLYDRLAHDSAESVRGHLGADLAYQEKLLRFIENHDEPRAASAFPPPKARALAVAVATLPGARLFHDGQFEGCRVRLPVFLGRRPVEPVDADLHRFYRTLLGEISREGLRAGRWQLCGLTGWADNPSHRNLLAWCWRSALEKHLIVVNLSGAGAQGRVQLPWEDLRGSSWQMTDLFSGVTYQRGGDEMSHPGLFVDLPPWGYHVLGQWRPMG